MSNPKYNFSHLNSGPAVRPEDVSPNLPFRHLLNGASSNSPARVEGWAHRTRSGGFVATPRVSSKERAR